jgi:hypothetical protein
MGMEDAKATVQKIREGNPAAWLALVNAKPFVAVDHLFVDGTVS